MQNSIGIAAWIDVANLPEEMRELRNGHMGMNTWESKCPISAVAKTQSSSHEEPLLQLINHSKKEHSNPKNIWGDNPKIVRDYIV